MSTYSVHRKTGPNVDIKVFVADIHCALRVHTKYKHEAKKDLNLPFGHIVFYQDRHRDGSPWG